MGGISTARLVSSTPFQPGAGRLGSLFHGSLTESPAGSDLESPGSVFSMGWCVPRRLLRRHRPQVSKSF